MSPIQFHDHQQAKKDINSLYPSPSPLKINKDSHFIKKLSPPSSSSSLSSMSSLVNGVAVAAAKPQQRHPVIIYTHSPKIIHTHPRDFMALVQKLTGLSRSEDDVPQPKSGTGNDLSEEKNKNIKAIVNDDNESSSVVTDENCSSAGDVPVNSCFVPPIFDPPNPFLSNIPFFTPNSTDFLCSTQPFYNYTDSLFFPPNMRSSISSSPLDGMKEFGEF